MAEASHDKPDLTNGVPENDLDDGAMLVGQVGEEAVLYFRPRTTEQRSFNLRCPHHEGVSPGVRAASSSPDTRSRFHPSTRCQPEVAQAVMPTTANDQVVVDRDAKRGGCLGIPPISSREQALNEPQRRKTTRWT